MKKIKSSWNRGSERENGVKQKLKMIKEVYWMNFFDNDENDNLHNLMSKIQSNEKCVFALESTCNRWMSCDINFKFNLK
jgi:hypothetical protein